MLVALSHGNSYQTKDPEIVSAGESMVLKTTRWWVQSLHMLSLYLSWTYDPCGSLLTQNIL